MDTKLNASSETSSSLYEQDFYAWTQEQAKLLREGAWKCLDVVNLVEEIESLGKQQRQELRNRLGVVLGHLLKWEFKTCKRSNRKYNRLRVDSRRLFVMYVN